MDLTAVVLPAGWTLAGWMAALPLLASALRRAPWSWLRADERSPVLPAAIFALLVLWNMQATIGDGYTFHLLGVGGLTLLVGPQLALVGGAVAVALQLAVRGGEWINAGIAWITMVALPVATMSVVLRSSERWLPPNFFVYVIVVTFFGAALSLGVAGVAGAVALNVGKGLPAALVYGEYLPYLLYLGFGEATLTGMVLTLAVVYRPEWVATFDDRRYIDGR